MDEKFCFLFFPLAPHTVSFFDFRTQSRSPKLRLAWLCSGEGGEVGPGRRPRQVLLAFAHTGKKETSPRQQKEFTARCLCELQQQTLKSHWESSAPSQTLADRILNSQCLGRQVTAQQPLTPPGCGMQCCSPPVSWTTPDPPAAFHFLQVQQLM